MAPRPEELEAAADQTRARITLLLDELRQRVTPGQVLDQAIEYSRHGPPAEFVRNLGREVRENPLPLVLIGAGIAWLAIAANRSVRAARQAAAENGEALADDVAGLGADGYADLRPPVAVLPVEQEALAAETELVDRPGWPGLHPTETAREPR